MCDLEYHICPECGEDYTCFETNDYCEVNVDRYPCAKCEYWIEEQRKDFDHEERMRMEANLWAQEHGFQDTED